MVHLLLIVNYISYSDSPVSEAYSFCSDFPWKNMAPGSTFCDIGSGVGGICLEIAAAQPHLKLTLQDQPHVLDKARDVS
jgi:O-methyltransferase domain